MLRRLIDSMWQATDPSALDPLLEQNEFEQIERALTKSFPNKAPAAELLNVT